MEAFGSFVRVAVEAEEFAVSDAVGFPGRPPDL